MLEGLGLLVGHLMGDYLLQNDWMAKNKTNQLLKLAGHITCTVHCLLYTISIYACSFWWIPWWGLLACFLTHWPIDRFRLARKIMDYIGQKDFATGPLSPWSIIVVDNTIHLLTLFLIALIHLRPWNL